MSCQEIEELLSAYVDREVRSEEKKTLERHLKFCLDCQRRVSWLGKLKEVVRQVPSPPIPSELYETLLGEAAQRRSPKSQALLGSSLLRYSLATVFAVVVVFILSGFPTGSSKDLSLEVLLAAHNQYAVTLPFAPKEVIISSFIDSTGVELNEM